MQLTPTQPPGRTNRKAREFEAEIGRFHAAGYSFASIRLALANVGVMVSRATVQREVARLSINRPRTLGVAAAANTVRETAWPTTRSADAPSDMAMVVPIAPSPTRRLVNGKGITQEFVNQHIANSLIPDRS